MRHANGTNYAPESTADGLVSQQKRRGKSACRWGPSGPKANQRKERKDVRDRKDTSHLGLFIPNGVALYPDMWRCLLGSQPRRNLCLLFSEGQSKRDQDQSNALNKTDFPLEVSKAFGRFDLKSIT